MSYQKEDFTVEAVSRETASSVFDRVSSFHCGNEYIDDYFRVEAKTDTRNAVYMMRNTVTQEIVGLAAVACTGVRISSYKLEEMIPSVIINYFAIDEAYQHLDFPGAAEEDEYRYGDFFLGSIISAVRELSVYAGVVDVVLYSVPKAVNFYKRNFFEEYAPFMLPENYSALDGCVPMFLSLI